MCNPATEIVETSSLAASIVPNVSNVISNILGGKDPKEEEYDQS